MYLFLCKFLDIINIDELILKLEHIRKCKNIFQAKFLSTTTTIKFTNGIILSRAFISVQTFRYINIIDSDELIKQ